MIGIEIIKPHVKLITPEEWFEKIPWLIEYCGRLSHKSEDRMKDGSSDKFIRKVAGKLGHESIIEHMGITYHVYCDRTCSHQLVRHRVAASYTQESQRYCDYCKGEDYYLPVILPPTIGDIPHGTILNQECIRFNTSTYTKDNPALRAWTKNCLYSYEDYRFLRDKGIPPEDARSVLPGATKTEVAVTYNLRMWRHVFKMRALNPKAQWQVRGVFKMLLADLSKRLPMFFDDLVMEE
jgi:thymidylate synthase (FAD)